MLFPSPFTIILQVFCECFAIFGGWYTDAECIEEYDLTKPVTSDIELFAKWTEASYTITIEYENEDGDTVTEEKEIIYGETTYGELLPELADKPGYIFEGWYNENGDHCFPVSLTRIGGLRQMEQAAIE